jgi:hypothetical protein
MDKRWQIDKDASDWECDPRAEELFHLRYFRSLPMEKKIQAVEEMCAIAHALRAGSGVREAGGVAIPLD